MPHSGLPPGVTRGADGKFVSTGDGRQFEDLEYFTFQQDIEVATGDYTGNQSAEAFGNGSTFEGVQFMNIDTITDRHEVAHLIFVDSHLSVYALGGGINGDSSHRVAVELSADPSLQAVDVTDAADTIDDQNVIAGDITGIETEITSTDSADLLHRPLSGTVVASYNDDTNGNGGGAGGNDDRAVGPPPGTWDFDRRDELFLNGVVEQDGTSAAPFGATVESMLVFGITE